MRAVMMATTLGASSSHSHHTHKDKHLRPAFYEDHSAYKNHSAFDEESTAVILEFTPVREIFKVAIKEPAKTPDLKSEAAPAFAKDPFDAVRQKSKAYQAVPFGLAQTEAISQKFREADLEKSGADFTNQKEFIRLALMEYSMLGGFTPETRKKIDQMCQDMKVDSVDIAIARVDITDAPRRLKEVHKPVVFGDGFTAGAPFTNEI